MYTLAYYIIIIRCDNFVIDPSHATIYVGDLSLIRAWYNGYKRGLCSDNVYLSKQVLHTSRVTYWMQQCNNVRRVTPILSPWFHVEITTIYSE